MSKTRIFHNPRCSKSRQTLALLQERGVDVEIVEYLKTPPDKADLDAILTQLGLEPADIVRRKESLYKELGLAERDLSHDEWLDILVANPILIERPIVVANGKARLGRPPEQVLEILQ